MDTTLPDPDGDLLAPGDPAIDDSSTEIPIGDESLRGADGRGNGGVRGRARGWWWRRPDDAIVGGVAVDLAARLGLDVLWVRLAFVVLLLVGGLGVVVYLGLWLTFVLGEQHPLARVVGGAILVAGVPLLIAQGDPSLATGTGAVVILLVGITLALWNRSATGPPPATSPPAGTTHPAGPILDEPVIECAGFAAESGATRQRRPRRVGPARPRSILGRTTLGAAVVVTAGGALIDELNGGRLHPEQWLGAGVVVCGVGLLVGTLRGHARWLVVPAVAFAVVGYVAGESAGLGLSLGDVGGGDRYHSVFADNRGSSDASLHSVFGSMSIVLDSAPREPARVDALGVFGDIVVTTSPDVTIQLIARADGGRVDIDGRSVGNGTHIIGPGGDPTNDTDGEPDVVIDARTVHGDISVFTYDPVPPGVDGLHPIMIEPLDPTIGVEERLLGEGVRLLRDGTVILWNGQGVIGPGNELLIGDWFAEDESRMVWPTEVGTWQLLGGVLVTPFGEVLDLDALRAGVVSPSPDVLLDDSDVATTTVPPSTAPTLAVPAGTVLPDTVLPDTVLPDTVLPDTVLPDTVLPDTVLPDTVLPDTVPLSTVSPVTVSPVTVSPVTVSPVTTIAPREG